LKSSPLTSDDINKHNIAVCNSKNYVNLNKTNRKKCVVNLDNRIQGPGTHWASVQELSDKDKVYLYQDSFGVKPCDLGLHDSLILYTLDKKQKNHETNCGSRSILSLNSKIKLNK
jgi:hypothetical protein